MFNTKIINVYGTNLSPCLQFKMRGMASFVLLLENICLLKFDPEIVRAKFLLIPLFLCPESALIVRDSIFIFYLVFFLYLYCQFFSFVE